MIARPHFFNDTVGETPLTVSYCILCNSAMAFKSELAGRPLDLQCVTANNNNIIYLDPASGNFIQQLDGRVFAGPDKGAELEPHPVVLTPGAIGGGGTPRPASTTRRRSPCATSWWRACWE